MDQPAEQTSQAVFCPSNTMIEAETKGDNIMVDMDEEGNAYL